MGATAEYCRRGRRGPGLVPQLVQKSLHNPGVLAEAATRLLSREMAVDWVPQHPVLELREIAPFQNLTASEVGDTACPCAGGEGLGISRGDLESRVARRDINEMTGTRRLGYLGA